MTNSIEDGVNRLRQIRAEQEKMEKEEERVVRVIADALELLGYVLAVPDESGQLVSVKDNGGEVRGALEAIG